MTVFSSIRGRNYKWTFVVIPMIALGLLIVVIGLRSKEFWFEDALMDTLFGSALFFFLALCRMLFKSHEAWTYLNQMFRPEMLDYNYGESDREFYDVVKINNLEAGGQVTWGYRLVPRTRRVPFLAWAAKSIAYSIVYTRNDIDSDPKNLPTSIEHP